MDSRGRTFTLLVTLALPSACGDADGGGNDSTGTDASASSNPSDPSASTDPSASSNPSTDPSATTNPSTDPSDSSGGGDSSSGEMTGCESGPLPGPLPGCTPTPPASTGDVYQDCVDRINQFRWECQCLPPLARWTDAEMCLDDQSAADQSGGVAHANFGMCGEYAQNTCPNWGSESDVVVGCLQAMWDEGPGEPFEEHGHYINMSNTQYTKVACGFAYEGGVWSNQDFSP